MLRFLSDENFNNDIIRGLLLRAPSLDVIRVQDLPLIGADDHQVLDWAAEAGRIVLTHDRATMPTAAFHRITANSTMPGVFVFGDRLPPGQVIGELLLIAECSEPSDWAGRVLYLPL